MKSDGPADKEMSTADRILAVATKYFLSYGVDRSNIDKIAAEACVGKNSIYALYANKAALFEDVIRKTVIRTGIKVGNMNSGSDDPEVALHDLALMFLEAFVNPEVRGLYRAIATGENNFPQLGARLKQQWFVASERLVECLQRIIEGHAAALDLEMIAEEFAAIVASGGRHLMGYDLPDDADRAFIASRSAALFLHGYAVAQVQVALPLRETPGTALHQEKPPQPGERAQMRLAPDRVARMLDLMADEFLRNGFEQASVDAVLARVKVSKATIYRQFGSKANLFAHVVTRMSEHVWPDDAPHLEIGDAPVDTLAAVAEIVMSRHLMKDSIALQRLVIAEAINFPELAIAVHKRILAVPNRYLQDALAAHALPAADEVSAHAFFVLATSGMRWTAAMEGPDAQQRADTRRRAAGIFYHGVSAFAASPHPDQAPVPEARAVGGRATASLS